MIPHPHGVNLPLTEEPGFVRWLRELLGRRGEERHEARGNDG